MQITSMQKALSAVSLLAIELYAGNAAAHTYNSSIGKAAGATDLYQVTCFDDGNGSPSRLAVSILDSPTQVPTPNPVISIQVFASPSTASAKAANSTDPTEDTKYSPEVSIVGGIGPYFIAVDHSKAGGGVENYTIAYHCLTSTGVHTGTLEPPIIRQNQ